MSSSRFSVESMYALISVLDQFDGLGFDGS